MTPGLLYGGNSKTSKWNFNELKESLNVSSAIVEDEPKVQVLSLFLLGKEYGLWLRLKGKASDILRYQSLILEAAIRNKEEEAIKKEHLRLSNINNSI